MSKVFCNDADKTRLDFWKSGACFGQHSIDDIDFEYANLVVENGEKNALEGKIKSTLRAMPPGFYPDQFTMQKNFPFVTSVLNEIALHPRVISAAQTILSCNEIRMHQCYTALKIEGFAQYEQFHHVDTLAHTLIDLSDGPEYHCCIINVMINDHTYDNGPLAYVPWSVTPEHVFGNITANRDDEAVLRDREIPAIGPAGTLFIYSPGVFHRATALTGRGAKRCHLTASFHRASATNVVGGNPWIKSSLINPAWNDWILTASSDDLRILGLPASSDPYWEMIRGKSRRFSNRSLPPSV